MNAVVNWPATATPLDADDLALIEAIQNGLSLTARPYAAIAAQTGLAETQVITRLRALLENGVIKRWGVVVRHRKLGYTANAMVVWDVPDAQVDAVAGRLAAVACVTLCYRRPRQRPHWPYNLFCMIHGRSREEVSALLDALIAEHKLATIEHAVLFSRHCFKQRGARFVGLQPRAR